VVEGKRGDREIGDIARMMGKVAGIATAIEASKRKKRRQR
jgi:hypothetical protein